MILPDVLQPNLKLVLCGTAASVKSAAAGAYYANPTNAFWRTLYAVGLTPRLFAPGEFALLPQYGIGLTDLAKFAIGNDNVLRPHDFDADALRAKIEHYGPRVLAFDSKNAAKVFFGRARVAYGLQAETIGDTVVFVLPSPSGAARSHWDISHWHTLAAYVREISL